VLLWHLGGTVAAARYIFRDERMDLRTLLLGAVLPDVIDTPVGLIGYSSLRAVRLGAHSLLFVAVVMVVVLLVTRRGRPRKRWMPLVVGLLMHLVLDAMWADGATLWWPLLGAAFSPDTAATAAGYLADVLSDWRVWALEAVGLAYLGTLAARAGMGDAAHRRRFFATGTVDVPIGRR